jgi:hypothetical protein
MFVIFFANFFRLGIVNVKILGRKYNQLLLFPLVVSKGNVFEVLIVNLQIFCLEVIKICHISFLNLILLHKKKFFLHQNHIEDIFSLKTFNFSLWTWVILAHPNDINVFFTNNKGHIQMSPNDDFLNLLFFYQNFIFIRIKDIYQLNIFFCLDQVQVFRVKMKVDETV